MFCRIKDQIQFQQKAKVVYRITCPGCYKNEQKYYNKNEHGTKPDQPVYQHLTNCMQFTEYLKFYALLDVDAVKTIVSKELHLHDAVIENTEIFHHSNKLCPFTILRHLLY